MDILKNSQEAYVDGSYHGSGENMFDLENPFVVTKTVAEDEFDYQGHASHASYMSWVDLMAWRI